MNLKQNILLLFLGLFLSCQLQAQERKFGLKIYPIPLAFAKTALQAELMLSAHRSLTIDYSQRDFDITRGILGRILENSIEEEKSGNYQSLLISPSFRMYSKKKEGPRGLYFALGVRYSKSEANVIVKTEDYPNTEVDVNSSMFGGQIDMGVQWLIGNRVAIDWNFLGLGAQFGKLEGFGVSTNFDPADAQDFADEVNRIAGQVPLVDLVFVAEDNTVSANGNQLLPFVRSRLAIGIFF